MELTKRRRIVAGLSTKPCRFAIIHRTRYSNFLSCACSNSNSIAIKYQARDFLSLRSMSLRILARAHPQATAEANYKPELG